MASFVLRAVLAGYYRAMQRSTIRFLHPRGARFAGLLFAAVMCGACTASAPVRPPRTVAASVQVSTATDAAAAGMVDVLTHAPTLRVDMRYAGSDNFVGTPVRGYEAPRCYLLTPVAQALARVQAALRAQGMSLVVYDCYRPVRAVRHFVAWAHDAADQRTKAAYYPRLDKARLLGDYIAESSGHSRGATVDVGLLRCRAETCEPLDMGTGFDVFDPRANTDSAEVTAAQRANRQHLLQAMRAQGFENYALEWWHYTLRPEPVPRIAHDFPVR
jgi:D-alanyl-D-alanine dipeptidase